MAFSFFEQLEGLGEEIQAENGGFVGEKIVGHVQSSHGGEVATNHAAGHQATYFGPLSFTVFELMERLTTKLLALWVVAVPLAHFAVEVPTVVVEGLR